MLCSQFRLTVKLRSHKAARRLVAWLAKRDLYQFEWRKTWEEFVEYEITITSATGENLRTLGAFIERLETELED